MRDLSYNRIQSLPPNVEFGGGLAGFQSMLKDNRSTLTLHSLGKNNQDWTRGSLVASEDRGSPRLQIFPHLELYVRYTRDYVRDNRSSDQLLHDLNVELAKHGLFETVPSYHRLSGAIDWLYDPELVDRQLQPAPKENVDGVTRPDLAAIRKAWRTACRNADDSMMRLSMGLYEFYSPYWKNRRLAADVGIEIAAMSLFHGYYREGRSLLRRLTELLDEETERPVSAAEPITADEQDWIALDIRRVEANIRAHSASVDTFSQRTEQYLALLKSVEQLKRAPRFQTTEHQRRATTLKLGILRGMIRSCFHHLVHVLCLQAPMHSSLNAFIKQCEQLPSNPELLMEHSRDAYERLLNFDTVARFYLICAMQAAFFGARNAAQARDSAHAAHTSLSYIEYKLRPELEVEDLDSARPLLPLKIAVIPGRYCRAITDLTYIMMYLIKARLAPHSEAFDLMGHASNHVRNFNATIPRERMHHLRRSFDRLELLFHYESLALQARGRYGEI